MSKEATQLVLENIKTIDQFLEDLKNNSSVDFQSLYLMHKLLAQVTTYTVKQDDLIENISNEIKRIFW